MGCTSLPSHGMSDLRDPTRPGNIAKHCTALLNTEPTPVRRGAEVVAGGAAVVTR